MPSIISGLEWDARLEKELVKNADHFDAIELIPENFFYGEKIQMKNCIAALKETKKPIFFHGVELSIGSCEALKENHLSNMLRLVDEFNPVVFSEHLSMTEAQGIEIGQLTPLAWSKNLADIISEKIIAVQKRLSIPFMIENVSNRFVFPHTELSETEFINRILSNTKCGLLLDITNVFTNSVNFHFDPYEWINSLELSYVSQIHLAGGAFDKDNILEDSHDQAVWDESWQLYQYVTEKIGPIPTIIERTGNIPQFNALIAEAARARQIQRTANMKELAA